MPRAPGRKRIAVEMSYVLHGGPVGIAPSCCIIPIASKTPQCSWPKAVLIEAGFRRREWGPAVEAAGIATPARLYDLRSTFASNALARGITVYKLARIMGTSVGMIEAHYGTLVDTAHDSLLERLEGA